MIGTLGLFGPSENRKIKKGNNMFIPSQSEVKCRNTEGKIIPKVLYTLARKWKEAAEAADLPLSGTPEEIREVLPNGTLGFSAEDAKVIQGVSGNGAAMFAEAFSEVVGAEWSASDRIASEEQRNPVKYKSTVKKGKRKGEQSERVFTSLHRAGKRQRKKAAKQ